MNLKEAKKRLEKLENNLNYYKTEREINLSRIGLSASSYDKINTSGGINEDKFVSYLVNLEEKDKLTLIELDKKISYTSKQINNLKRWIDNELETLKKYRDVEQFIVFNREKENPVTWEEIAKEVNYCVRHCQRIYEKYRKGEENGICSD